MSFVGREKTEDVPLGHPKAQFAFGTVGICSGTCDGTGVCDKGTYKCNCLTGCVAAFC